MSRLSRRLLYLEGLGRHSDVGLLVLRILTGAFLVYGVVDNVVSAERMQEFSDFLASNGFPAPSLMAPLSVYVQLLCGLSLVFGLLTRWAGILIALNFIVAVIMVHWPQDFRGWWPAIVLVGIGAQFALTGAGRISVDALLANRKSRSRDSEA